MGCARDLKANVCCQVKVTMTQGFTLFFAGIWVKGIKQIHKVITLLSKNNKPCSSNKFYFGNWGPYSKQFWFFNSIYLT